MKKNKTNVSSRMADEGWVDFKGLTLTSPNKRAGPGGNSSKQYFGPSSSNKQTIWPKPGPRGQNSSMLFFARPKAQKGGCTHCGGNKHTKDMFFQLHRYLKWWYELKGKKQTWPSNIRYYIIQIQTHLCHSKVNLIPQLKAQYYWFHKLSIPL